MLPPLSAPCPSRLLRPARYAQGLFLGVEVWQLDVALLRAAALPGGMHFRNGRVLLPLLQVAASLPRASRKKRAFPLMSGGAASAGVCLAPAVHAPPPLSMRDLTLDDQPKFSRLGIALQTRCREPLVWFLRSTWMFMRFPFLRFPSVSQTSSQS